MALVMDGKTFGADQLVIALGVTVHGEKRVLGLVQTATENRRVCAAFLWELEARGFAAPHGLLVVLDGAKGLRATVAEVFGAAAQVQRCQWHYADLRIMPTWAGKAASERVIAELRSA